MLHYFLNYYFFQASDIYQMFSVLCDVVIFNENKTEASYLEAVPCALVSKLEIVTGHKVSGPIMMISLEYGKNFSGPGKDVFNSERALGEAKLAYQSNFLHPVLYFYSKLVTVNDYLHRPEKWPLPIPDDIHHIVEDFTTKFDGPATHILPVRRFLERITQRDHRFWFSDQCLKLSLTYNSLPLGCRTNEGNGSSWPITASGPLDRNRLKMSAHLLPFVAAK